MNEFGEFLKANPSGVFAIFGSLVTFIFTYYTSKKERTYNFKKEEYYKSQERLEVIFEFLNFYMENANIIKNSLITGNHFEEDFSSNEIKKRESVNGKKGNDYLYIYHTEMYEEFLECMALYKKLINSYFDKILGAPKNGLSLNYTIEDKKLVFENLNKFNKNFDSILNKIKDSNKSLKKELI